MMFDKAAEPPLAIAVGGRSVDDIDSQLGGGFEQRGDLFVRGQGETFRILDVSVPAELGGAEADGTYGKAAPA